MPRDGCSGCRDRPWSCAAPNGSISSRAPSGTSGSPAPTRPGMALRLDAPVIVHTAEHYNRGARAWSCAAAPVHDPRTGAVLGVIDLTGGSDVASRQALSLIHATARLAEAELARLHASRRPPPTHDSGPPPSPGGLRVDGLGLPGCAVQIGDRTLRLSPRHSEIIVILADHPAGLTGDELAVELYHADAPTSTIRAELARLRALLGAEWMGSRAYLLRAQPECDWLAVTAYLAAGRVREAVRAYRGPLLPRSDAPGVVTRRMRLQRELRAAVLASGDTDLLVSWTRTPWGADDLPVWRRRSAPFRAGHRLPTWPAPRRGTCITSSPRTRQGAGPRRSRPRARRSPDRWPGFHRRRRPPRRRPGHRRGWARHRAAPPASAGS